MAKSMSSKKDDGSVKFYSEQMMQGIRSHFLANTIEDKISKLGNWTKSQALDILSMGFRIDNIYNQKDHVFISFRNESVNPNENFKMIAIFNSIGNCFVISMGKSTGECKTIIDALEEWSESDDENETYAA